jgi:hypothetical protein
VGANGARTFRAKTLVLPAWLAFASVWLLLHGWALASMLAF